MSVGWSSRLNGRRLEHTVILEIGRDSATIVAVTADCQTILHFDK
jgi:hypothetical protein